MFSKRCHLISMLLQHPEIFSYNFVDNWIVKTWPPGLRNARRMQKAKANAEGQCGRPRRMRKAKVNAEGQGECGWQGGTATKSTHIALCCPKGAGRISTQRRCNRVRLSALLRSSTAAEAMTHGPYARQRGWCSAIAQPSGLFCTMS